MALKNVMRVDDGNVIGGGGTGGNSVEIDWEDWCELTPEEQENGDWTIINCPWADGDVSVDLMTKLWENPNPTAEFSAQTVALSDMNYDLYFIVFDVQNIIGSDWDVTYLLDAKSSSVNYVETASRGNTALYARGCKVTSNGITFMDAYAQTTLSNTNMVPLIIYGIKLTATVKINAIAMDVSTSADKCMLSENESVKDRLDANNIGTAVNITSYTTTRYVAPSDGYLQLTATSSTSTRIRAVIYGADETNSVALTAVYNQVNTFNSIFVKKGMKITITVNENSGVAYFFPLS